MIIAADLIPELIQKVRICIDLFYANDFDLIQNNLHEESIGAQLKSYLNKEFPGYSVDCNYNRHITDKKRGLNQKLFRPDIVVHKRKTDEFNLIYFELKTEKNKEDRQLDIDKIIYATLQGGKFEYGLGIFVDFTVDKANIKIRYFVDGEEWS